MVVILSQEISHKRYHSLGGNWARNAWTRASVPKIFLAAAVTLTRFSARA